MDDTKREPALEKVLHREHEQKLLAIEGMTDIQRSKVPLIHDQWNSEGHYYDGRDGVHPVSIVRRNEVLYKCLQEHDAQSSWKPEDSPSLWVKIMYRDGIRIIEENIPADNPFYSGNLGWWGDVIYRSILPAANVHNPEQYPAGWEVAVQND